MHIETVSINPLTVNKDFFPFPRAFIIFEQEMLQLIFYLSRNLDFCGKYSSRILFSMNI